MQKDSLDLKAITHVFFNKGKDEREDLNGVLKGKVQKLGNYIGKIKVDFLGLNGEQIWQLMDKRLQRKFEKCQSYFDNFEREKIVEMEDMDQNEEGMMNENNPFDNFSLLRKRESPEVEENDQEINAFDFAGEDDGYFGQEGGMKKLKQGRYAVEGVDDKIKKNLNEQDRLEEEARIEREMKDYFEQLEEEEMQANMNEEERDPGLGIEEDEFIVGENDDEGLNFDHLKGDFDIEGIDDEEYEKLLQQGKEEDGDMGVEGEADEEQEQEEEDEEQEYEAEDGVFEEMREKEMQIETQEKKLLQDKPWQMKGEVRAYDRPKNALLDVNVEFTHGVESKEKKAPEVHQSIDEMIKSRILTEAFDDPRHIVINHDLQDQNDAELNFQRDKNSLSSYYEEDYKRRMLGLPLESKEDKIKSQILELFKEVNMHLDYMTNMTYTPMPVHSSKIQDPAKDIKVIQLEEKTPITFKTLDSKNAKQQFQARQSEFLGGDEKTHEDNRRIRRIAKRRMRANMKKKKMKSLQEQLDFKGQTKYEYNLVNKARKMVEREHENSSAGMVNMTKSSQFFKTLQDRKDNKHDYDYERELKDKKKMQKKLKL